VRMPRMPAKRAYPLDVLVRRIDYYRKGYRLHDAPHVEGVSCWHPIRWWWYAGF
jgi:hypothetical protein